MRHSKTTEYVTCDRCGDQHTLDGLPSEWITIHASYITNWRAAETSHDLCQSCSAEIGRFLNGDFVPPIPDKIEQPYESLTGDDFFDPFGSGVPPWECYLMHDGHVWAWDRAKDGVFKRHCTRCSLLWTSSARTEGTK